MANGNGWMAKSAIGALWGVLVMVILFMGNVVRANDENNHTSHNKIRKEAIEGHNNVRKELKEELALLRKDVHLQGKETTGKLTEILVAIEKIKK